MDEATQSQQGYQGGKSATGLHALLGHRAVGANPPTATQPEVPDNNSPSAVQAATLEPATSQVNKPGGFDLTIPEQPHEIRRDYIFDEYVIIAPGRHKRPFDFKIEEQPLIETAQSPHLDDQPAIDSIGGDSNGSNWHVRSVENKYPALTLNNPRAYGSQEIVIDTPLSNMPMARLSTDSVCEILTMYQRRIRDLSKTPHVKYIQIFKNEGRHAGASLAHSHTQIFALPLIPPRFSQRHETILNYLKDKHTDPYADIITFELKAKERVIANSDHSLTIAPYASAWPLEAWILPKRNMQSFADANQTELRVIAESLLILLRKLDGAQLNFNFFIEEGLSEHQRWVLKLCGRDVVSPLGGLEVATGIVINTIPPEAATKWYKS